MDYRFNTGATAAFTRPPNMPMRSAPPANDLRAHHPLYARFADPAQVQRNYRAANPGGIVWGEQAQLAAGWPAEGLFDPLNKPAEATVKQPYLVKPLNWD